MLMVVFLLTAIANKFAPYLFEGSTSLAEDVAILSQAQTNPWMSITNTSINRHRILSGGRIILSHEESRQIVDRVSSIGVEPTMLRAILPRGIISEEQIEDMVHMLEESHHDLERYVNGGIDGKVAEDYLLTGVRWQWARPVRINRIDTEGINITHLVGVQWASEIEQMIEVEESPDNLSDNDTVDHDVHLDDNQTEDTTSCNISKAPSITTEAKLPSMVPTDNDLVSPTGPTSTSTPPPSKIPTDNDLVYPTGTTSTSTPTPPPSTTSSTTSPDVPTQQLELTIPLGDHIGTFELEKNESGNYAVTTSTSNHIQVGDTIITINGFDVGQFDIGAIRILINQVATQRILTVQRCLFTEQSYASPMRDGPQKRRSGTNNKSPHKTVQLKSKPRVDNAADTSLLSPDFLIPPSIANTNGSSISVEDLASIMTPIMKLEEPILDAETGTSNKDIANALSSLFEEENVGTASYAPPLFEEENTHDTVELDDTNNADLPPYSMEDVPRELFGNKFKSFVPVKAIRVIGGKQLRSMDPTDLNDAEKECLFGAGGYITEHLPVYGSDKEGKKKKASNKMPTYEYAGTYYCKGRTRGDANSCQFVLKIMRIEGGLVVMQKCDTIEGSKVPIGHNENADNIHKATTHTNDAEGLSVNQKKFIIWHCGDGDAEWLVKQMTKPGNRILCSNAQHSNTNSFVSSVKSFIKENNRYFPAKNSDPNVMPQKVLKEVLEALKSEIDRSGNDPIVGPSMHSYYTSDDYRRFLWTKTIVIDHDIGAVAGQFTNIIFAPTDYKERCAKAACMYPGGKVQLEIDFFHPNEEMPYQVGHVGVSDCNHKYWPIAYIIAPREDKDSCWKLLKTGIHLIEQKYGDNPAGQVSTLLSDGGGGILSAIDAINVERAAAGKSIIKKRRCFAHNIRMPNTNGGGKRGGKGSLPRYLLDNLCPADIMAKIMAKIILFNFLPDADTYRVATKLLIDEYRDYINDHVLQNYLDPEDPNKIGGRVANEFQGQNGSTQGVERRGGYVKDKLSTQVKGMTESERSNPLNVMYAVAEDMHFKFSKGVQNFATEPRMIDADNDIIKQLAAWNGGAISADMLYMLFKDENNQFVNSEECIGKSGRSYTAYLPTMSNVYTTYKQMKNEEASYLAEETFAMQQTQSNYDPSSTDYRVWRQAYQLSSDEERVELKKRLVKKLVVHTVESHDGEDTYGYLLRHGQRLPQAHKSQLIRSDLKLKKISTLKNEKRMRDEQAKWAVTKCSASGKSANVSKKGGKKKAGTKKKVGSDDEPKISLSCENLGVELDVDIDEDISLEGLWDVLNVYDKEVFDEKERETYKLIQKELRVCMPRELGDWITVKVNADGERVHCNCNRCNFDGRCGLVSAFESLQFGKVPHNLPGGTELDWNRKVHRAVTVAKLNNIDLSFDELMDQFMPQYPDILNQM